MLPDISIKLDSTPKEFISRVEKLAQKLGFKTELHNDCLGSFGYDILNIAQSEASYAIGPIIQLINNGEHKIDEKEDFSVPTKVEVIKQNNQRIEIEARSTVWDPFQLSSEEYVKTAKELINPILREYNRIYKTNRRLKIQAKKQYVIPEKAKNLLTKFAILANKKSVHPLDWQRFYAFIFHSHKQNTNISQCMVFSFLKDTGFTNEKATFLSDIYFHCRELLEIRKKL